MPVSSDVNVKAQQIKMVIFDVDGVLTDGSLFIDNHGEEYKAFNSRDGLGMRILQDTGILVGVITGRTSGVVEHRMNSLKLDPKNVFQGQTDKIPAFLQLCQQNHLHPNQTAYVGDDIIDIPVLNAAGLSIATADAHLLTKQHSDWVTTANGGRGAARDVCEMIMQAQGTWQAQLKNFAAA